MSDAEVEMAFAFKHEKPAPLPETVFVLDAKVNAYAPIIEALTARRPSFDRDRDLENAIAARDALLERRLKLTDAAQLRALEKEF